MVRRGKARELCGTIAGLPWHHEIEREGEKDKERDRHGQGKRVRGGRERKSTRVRERERGRDWFAALGSVRGVVGE